MDDSRFVKDKRDVFQPFSHGPRDCARKNLANVELDPRSKGWFDKLDVRNVWTKPELLIKLREA